MNRTAEAQAMPKAGPNAPYMSTVQSSISKRSAGGNAGGNFLRLSKTSSFVVFNYPFNSLPDHRLLASAAAVGGAQS
jgi:hypothetical protein